MSVNRSRRDPRWERDVSFCQASGMAVREKNTFIEVGRSGPEEEVWPRVSTWAAGQGQEDFGKGTRAGAVCVW